MWPSSTEVNINERDRILGTPQLLPNKTENDNRHEGRIYYRAVCVPEFTLLLDLDGGLCFDPEIGLIIKAKPQQAKEEGRAA